MDRITVAYFRSLMHRYYTPYLYYPSGACYADRPSEQILVSLHTNKKENLGVVRIDVKRPAEDIRGKKKNGAAKVKTHETICSAVCEDGREFSIRAGVSGRIIEINDQLQANPNLIKDPGQGFICIILTQLGQVQAEIHGLEKADPDQVYSIDR